ncbi:MAG: cytochrome P450 [Pseudomonadales bacterium]|nr:cytochrome P450 [Pseudomonadales bacterium]
MAETAAEPFFLDPGALDLASVDPSDAGWWRHDRWQGLFRRLRAEDPVHFCAHGIEGPFWSITRHDDVKYVDTHPELFSSEGSIVLAEPEDDFPLPMFIAMDPPRHDDQRKVVSPVVAPMNLKQLEGTIRGRAGAILDSLPVGETFNWVDKVSIELTTQMLATLFDFPFEDRRKLTRWSDVSTADIGGDIVATEEQQRVELLECLAYFNELWRQRIGRTDGNDLISMLANGEATKNMSQEEFLGNLVLLIVGGNDTTRNSITGGVLALNLFPDEYARLRANPGLIPGMVPEIVRWQTPLAYMRRTAMQDTEIRGRRIRKGDKLAMWYASGNRDEAVFDDADSLRIDRPNARQHVSFGYGIHRCMGNRLAEMQLRVLWEEILQRFRLVEVVGTPERVPSSFVKGYLDLPVVVHPL